MVFKLVAIGTLTCLIAVPALAQTASNGIGRSSVTVGAASASSPGQTTGGVQVGRDESVDLSRWWGAIGAAICGVGIRLTRVPVIGMNPYVIAPAIAGCMLALMDALT